MEWPLRDEETGKFLTTQTAKLVWKQALEAVMAMQGDSSLTPELDDRVEDLLERLDECLDWRKDYRQILGEFGRICSELTSKQVLVVAAGGLEALHNAMNFRVENDRVVSAKEAFHDNAVQDSGWDTRTICGGKPCIDCENVFCLPSPRDPTVRLTGHEAVAQVEAWVDYGCAEPSVGLHAMKIFCARSELLHDMLCDKVFILLDATSELGPAKPLLQLSEAHVLGITTDNDKLSYLTEWFEKEGNAEATLKVPEHNVHLLADGPRIARWIVENLPSDRNQVVVCHLAYADGEAHVRASVAMDLISEHVTRHCDECKKSVCLSFLSSPANVHCVPPDAARGAHNRFSSRPFWQRAVRTTTGALQTWDFDERPYPVLNGLVTLQGPNYALAKTMQQWRCMVAASCSNRLVSAPVAPATRSESMVRHDATSTYLEGIQRVEPMLSFDKDQASCLMAAILLSQLTTQLPPRLEHPMQLFWDGSVHGGVWRCPYEPESTGRLAYVIGKTAKRSRWVPTGSMVKN